MGSRVVSPQRLINLHQLDVNFEKLTTYVEHLTTKQYTESDSLISADFALEVLFKRYDVMRTL